MHISKAKLIQSLPLVALILVSVFLRFYKLGEIPVGLNQDEASTMVEAKALLETGADRWGTLWPVYFASWGSGQNVLLSYLSIPFIAIFGMSIWSTRIVAALLGVFAVWLMYKLVTRLYNSQLGPKIGLLAGGLLAVLPWHLVASRWGLESNIMPVFLLCGVYLITKTLQQKFTSVCINQFARFLDLSSQYLCLVPLAIALYGYGAAIAVVPILLFLILIFYFKTIFINWRQWLVSVFWFLFAAFPILLFVIKNYITKVNYPFEKFLPFTAPLLEVTRLDQIGGNRSKIWLENYDFAINGFNDTLPWNTVPGFETIPKFLFIFVFIAVVWIIIELVKSKISSDNTKTDFQSVQLLPLLWLFSCLGNLALIPANVNRANSVYIPLIILIAMGIAYLGSNLNKYRWQYFVAVIGSILVYSILFTNYYFGTYPTKFNFPRLLEEPFSKIKNNKNPTLISNQLPIHYIYILFYTPYPIAEFQKEQVNSKFDVRKVGNFYIDPNLLTLDRVTEYDFLLSKSQTACNDEVITFSNSDWKVGKCKAKELIYSNPR
jgi:4-amino-4-deoxy-L-arabinose transferase-like glycosyltransferase